MNDRKVYCRRYLQDKIQEFVEYIDDEAALNSRSTIWQSKGTNR